METNMCRAFLARVPEQCSKFTARGQMVHVKHRIEVRNPTAQNAVKFLPGPDRLPQHTLTRSQVPVAHRTIVAPGDERRLVQNKTDPGDLGLVAYEFTDALTGF